MKIHCQEFLQPIENCLSMKMHCQEVLQQIENCVGDIHPSPAEPGYVLPLQTV